MLKREYGHLTDVHVGAQTSAAWSSLDKKLRAENLSRALKQQNEALCNAIKAIDNVWDFIGSPKKILGSAKTKHGEIAEQVHVGVRRAQDFVQQRTPSSTFENVPRTDPVDYMDNGQAIQSKFYNGIENTLIGVLGHDEKYPGFSVDGAYHVPKDQFEQMQQLLETGTIDGLSERKINRILALIEEVEMATGKPAGDVIKAGEATYSEVQQGRAHDTLDDRESTVIEKNELMKAKAHEDNAASWGGAANAAALGAAAGGGVTLVQNIWRKHRDGRNLFKGDYTIDDWRDLGLNVTKGAGIGAISGSALYFLTNSTDLAAPFAGAVVSSITGVGTLCADYRSGKIDQDQFVESSYMIATEAAIVSVSVLAGQTLIPIPLLGAFIGSCAGKFVASVVASEFGEAEAGLSEKLKAYEAESIRKLDNALREALDNLDAYFGQLSALIEASFDKELNIQLRVQASIDMAESLGVQEHEILRSVSELNAFMEE